MLITTKNLIDWSLENYHQIKDSKPRTEQSRTIQCCSAVAEQFGSRHWQRIFKLIEDSNTSMSTKLGQFKIILSETCGRYLMTVSLDDNFFTIISSTKSNPGLHSINMDFNQYLDAIEWLNENFWSILNNTEHKFKKCKTTII